MRFGGHGAGTQHHELQNSVAFHISVYIGYLQERRARQCGV